MGKRDDAGKAVRSTDRDSDSERRHISISIGIVLAAAVAWFLYWIRTEGKRMRLGTAQSIGIYRAGVSLGHRDRCLAAPDAVTGAEARGAAGADG